MKDACGHESHFRYRQRLTNFDDCQNPQFNANKLRNVNLYILTVCDKTLKIQNRFALKWLMKDAREYKSHFRYQQQHIDFDSCRDPQFNVNRFSKRDLFVKKFLKIP